MIRRPTLLLSVLAVVAVASLANGQIDRAKIVETTKIVETARIVKTLRKGFDQKREIRELLERDADVRRRFEKWLNANAQEQLEALTGETPAKPALRTELLTRMQRDQDVRKKGAESTEAKSEWLRVDKENRIWLAKVIAEFGWPGKTLVGRDGAHAAWLLVQHASQDVPFQSRCLKLMQAAPEGEVAGRDVAYLVDRVRNGEGKRQLYGTQLKVVDGKLLLEEVEDAPNVNRRREELAMIPIEVYLLFCNSNKQFLPQRPKAGNIE